MAGRPGTGTVLAGVGVLALVAVLVLPGGTTDDPDGEDVSSGSHRLNLVAYSVPKPGFSAVIPGFRDTPDGQDTGFAESYGASGDQSRKVARHAPADLVNFSLEPDITRLVDDGLVAGDWKDDVPGDESGRSVPFGSVVSFVTRPGNPNTSRTGTTCWPPASRSSHRTRPRPARRSGTCSPRTPPGTSRR